MTNDLISIRWNIRPTRRPGQVAGQRRGAGCGQLLCGNPSSRGVGSRRDQGDSAEGALEVLDRAPLSAHRRRTRVLLIDRAKPPQRGADRCALQLRVRSRRNAARRRRRARARARLECRSTRASSTARPPTSRQATSIPAYAFCVAAGRSRRSRPSSLSDARCRAQARRSRQMGAGMNNRSTLPLPRVQPSAARGNRHHPR